MFHSCTCYSYINVFYHMFFITFAHIYHYYHNLHSFYIIDTENLYLFC